MAAIYVLGERLFALPMSKTDVGVWAGLDAPSSSALTESDAGLGEFVDQALNRSRTGRPHPPREQLNRLLDPLVRMAGVSRASEFQRQAGLINIERGQGGYRAVRAVKVLEKGSSRVWFGEDAEARDLVSASREELGAVIRELATTPETIRSESRAR